MHRSHEDYFCTLQKIDKCKFQQDIKMGLYIDLTLWLKTKQKQTQMILKSQKS